MSLYYVILFKNVTALSMGALLWAGAGAWAQDAPASVGKAKKWSGKLVDAPCMMKALNIFAAPTQSNATHDGPHFLGGSPQPAQYPGRSPAAPVTAVGRSPATADAVWSDPAATRRAAIDNAARQCAATPSSSSFGLTLGDGHVLKFDGDGDSKISQAVKDVELEPGKAVEATVKGLD